jgi:predicted ester cyclase
VNQPLYALVILAVCTLPCKADETDNVRVVSAMIEAINSRNLGGLDAIVSPNVVRHSAATPGVVVTSLTEFRTFLEADIATIPDSVQEIDIIFGSGDYVAIRARLIGTQSGPMGQFPASGNKLELPFMGILRIENGKIAEMWVEWDNLSALTQLGHFPPPEN